VYILVSGRHSIFFKPKSEYRCVKVLISYSEAFQAQGPDIAKNKIVEVT
jgi:hypothetical protein